MNRSTAGVGVIVGVCVGVFVFAGVFVGVTVAVAVFVRVSVIVGVACGQPLMIVCALAVGCGAGPDGFRMTVLVTGEVTTQGFCADTTMFTRPDVPPGRLPPVHVTVPPDPTGGPLHTNPRPSTSPAAWKARPAGNGSWISSPSAVLCPVLVTVTV
jgi:hypothetical protein